MKKIGKSLIFILIFSCCLSERVFSKDRIQNKDLSFQCKVGAKIGENLIIPDKYLEKKTQAISSQILVQINELGNIKTLQWQKRSGQDDFDEACMGALEKTSKLPQPPHNLWVRVLHDGLLVECISPNVIKVNFFEPSDPFCSLAKTKMEDGMASYRRGLPKEDASYLQELNDKIRKKYAFSAFEDRKISLQSLGENKRIAAVVGVDIDATGKIVKSELFCPSYNKAYNEAILKLLNKIKSFPPPSQHLLASDGLFRFMFAFTLHIDSY